MKKTLKKIDLTLISQFILGLIVLLIGIVVMVFKSFGLNDIVLYISILFYTFAFFSTITYFVRRKEGDYELLILSLVNIITATFMYVLKEDNVAMILGAGMTVYTVLLVANRGYKILTLKSLNSFMWIIKFIVTFLIAFLGILTTYNLFNEVTVQTMMFGYYFISLGTMLTIENTIEMFVTDSKFKKVVGKLVEEPKKELEEIQEETKTKKEIKKVESKVTTTKQPKNEQKNGTKKSSSRPKTTKTETKKTSDKKTTTNKAKKETTKTNNVKQATKKSPGRPKSSTKTTKNVTKKPAAKQTAKKSPGRPKKTNK